MKNRLVIVGRGLKRRIYICAYNGISRYIVYEHIVGTEDYPSWGEWGGFVSGYHDSVQ